MQADHFTHQLWRKPDVLIATGFGTGLFPIAPGTFTSLITVLVWYFIVGDLPILYRITVVLVLLLIAFYALRLLVSRTGVADESEITIDEVCGQTIALAWVPFDVWYVMLAFVLFRLLDIWKPGFIGFVDRKVKGTCGILLDDVVAGFLGGFCVYLLSTTELLNHLTASFKI